MSERGTLNSRMDDLKAAHPSFSWDTCQRIAKAELMDWDVTARRLERDRANAERRTTERKVLFKTVNLAGSAEQPVVMTNGHLHRLGDEDSSEIAPIMRTRSMRFQSRVEKAFREICREGTGDTETPAATEKRKAKEEKLLAQTRTVCAGLERAGKLAYRSDGWDMWTFDPFSREFVDLPSFRRICLLPWIAHRLRMPYLNWLEYWLQDHRMCRFWTFTSGERCRIGELDARIRYLNRRLSTLNGQQFMKMYGVEIVLRADELGTVENTNRKAKYSDVIEAAGEIETDAGGHWYHPHAHCVVWLRNGKLKPWQWSRLLSKIGDWWGHNWDEGKRIRDSRECVKYIVKPGDVVRLAETDTAELGRLHEVLFRKKLLHPMGELAKQMKAAKIAGLIPCLRWRNERLKWVLEKDHNKSLMADGSESSGVVASDGSDMTNSQAEKYFKMMQYGLGNPVDRGSANLIPTKGSALDELRDRKDREKAHLPTTRIMARCVPAFNSRGVKAPRVVGCGIKCVETLMKHPLIVRMMNATRENYEVGLMDRAAKERAEIGSGISVHTGTAAVPVVLGCSHPPPFGGPPDPFPAHSATD